MVFKLLFNAGLILYLSRFMASFFEKLFNSNSYNPLNSEVIRAYNKTRVNPSDPILCYAPFKSIYFGHHGLAHACCYNRKHILGEFPKQSIREIWFGVEADKLRSHIKNKDLSLGCRGCKEQLIAGNYDAVKTRQYDDNASNANRFPSVMEFELSNVCNLECEMCTGEFSSLIRSKREKLPPLGIPYNTDFVNQLEEFIPYLEEVKFYGGEPFLIDIYYDIWEKIRAIKPSVRISVQTNGTTLNNRVKRILESTNFHINISIDALDKSTYEFIRKNATLERTMENIAWFREYTRNKKTFFGISVCAMQQNWKQLPDFINYCNELDAPVYFHTVLAPAHCSIRTLGSEEIKQVVDYLSGFSFTEETAIQKKNSIHYKGIVGQFKKWYEDSFNDLRKKKIESFHDFENLVAEFIMQDKAVHPDKREERKKRVIVKLRELTEKLGDDFFHENIHRLDIDNPYLLDVITNQIEKLPVSVLVIMAKAGSR